MSVSISDRKGVAKRPRESIKLVAGKGIVGDAHFGFGKRQVSLLPWEEVEEFNKSHRTQIGYGAFAENIAIKGLPPTAFRVGQLLKIGDVVLRVTQIGKECHSGCNIEKLLGECIMPKFGVFCEVISGGEIKTGDTIEIL